jgi:hypothetical protein
LFDAGQPEQNGSIVISACRADETDDEVDVGSNYYMGPLSYALSIALGEAGETTTYHQVINRVETIMRSLGLTQEPQVEGNWDKTLFKGIRAKPSNLLTADIDNATQLPILMAGFPMGITVGSKYNLFRQGANPKTAPPIATAVVRCVYATHADLDCSLSDNVAMPDLRGATAIITERNYTPTLIKVDLSSVAHHTQFKDIQSALDDVSVTADMKAAATGYEKNYSLRIMTAAAAALLSDDLKKAIGNDASPDSLVIQRAGGALLRITVKNTAVAVLANDADLPLHVQSAVSQYVCWRTVNELRNQDGNDAIKIEVKYVPCEINKETRKIIRDLPPAYSTGHQLEMKVGIPFYCLVRNTGTKDAYVSILDLTSEGTVYALWPRAGVATSNRVKADGEWHKTLQFNDDHTSVPLPMRPPLGPDSVRVVATIKQSNFSFLDNRYRDKTEADKDSLSALLNNATVGHGTHFGPADDGWNVFGFSYTIVPK